MSKKIVFENNKSIILMSIKPKYLKKIFSGEKKFEFRKKKHSKDGIKKIIFYASNPIKMILGEAEIDDILEGGINQIWETTKDYAGITREEFDEYYSGHSIAVAYKLKNIKKYEIPEKLSDFGIKRPPQSYIYFE